ncbi:MAG: hypothetical protein M3Y80_10755 [Verrucomicrobiota bacterium]|nr:hypothetical protein [Verrucomicrobiota bacterium]
MKPTCPTTQISNRRDSFAARQMRSISSKTDCCFQASAPDFSGSNGSEGRPKFRRLSEAYFEEEAHGHFKAEALVFGVIALTAAVPVIEGVRGLFQFVYGML